MMRLEGSCHCGAVHFHLNSAEPVPYQRCYCSICRKTQGGGGYAINLGGDARTLKVTGQKNITVYHAKMPGGGKSSAERHFCSKCGTGLWLFSPEWPELVHPFASAIDTALPVAPEHTHLMLAYKPGWVEVAKGRKDKMFDEYPEESLAAWHERVGVAK
jgi:hypothetical protein